MAALVVLAPLALFVLSEPPSASGASYVIGAIVLAASLVLRRHARRVAFAGAALVVVPMCVRIAGTKKCGDVRAIDRVIDERDLAVNASRALAWTHFIRDPDVPLLPDAMRDAYDEMKKEEGDLPSPVVATYLGLERPGASDAIEFTHAEGARDAVIFLHGYAGNFTLSCWLFARAANMTTVCPSTRWIGDWWTPDGEAIVRAEIASLEQRGFKNIFLAGLSNGAIGASRLAPKLSEKIAGLVLVSGAASDARAPNVPTLVIQGRKDAQIPAPIVHAYAARTNARYVELDAGHFALLVDHEEATAAVRDWLRSTHGASRAAR